LSTSGDESAGRFDADVLSQAFIMLADAEDFEEGCVASAFLFSTNSHTLYTEAQTYYFKLT